MRPKTVILVLATLLIGSACEQRRDIARLTVCGDGVVDPGEECDDGNAVQDDGCSSICREEHPCLRFEPKIFDFALVQGQRGPVEASLINCGALDITLTRLEIDGSEDFTIAAGGAESASRIDGSWALGPGDAVGLQVRSLIADASPPLDAIEPVATLRARADGTPMATAALYGPPVANAGNDEDPGIFPTSPSFLDGRGSLTPGNQTPSFSWTVVEHPVGSQTALDFNAGLAQAPTYPDAPTCPAGQNTSGRPCFIADVAGVYRFELSLTDERPDCALLDPGGGCTQDADCCSFSCGSDGECDAGGICRPGGGCRIPAINLGSVQLRSIGEGLSIVLTWDGVGDLDLHLAEHHAGRCANGDGCADDTDCAVGSCDQSQRGWTRDGDCYGELNRRPDWASPRVHNGVVCQTSSDCTADPQYPSCVFWDAAPPEWYCTDTLDDPELDIDDVDGWGPEELIFRLPSHRPGPPNIYHLGVHFSSAVQATASRNATVQVFYEGQQIYADGLTAEPLTRGLSYSSTPVIEGDFWFVGWLLVRPTDASLIASPDPNFPVTASWPALQDPP